MEQKYCLFYIFSVIFVERVAGGELCSLTFVIDDTSSMWDDIAQVRTGASAIFDTVLHNKDESQIDNFILVTFNDLDDSRYAPDLHLRAKTKDRSVFMSALSAISPRGGAYSCAELQLAGIRMGLEESLPKSTIYVFTDATAKDYNDLEKVKRIALEKQSQIVFVLTGTCGESVNSPGYKVYHDMAKATKGHVFHMNKGEINKILEYVKKTITGQRTTVAAAEIPRGVHNFDFNADVFMEDLIMSFASAVSNNPSVKVKAPDGTDVLTQLLFETLYAKAYTMNVTKPGKHTVEVNSPSAGTEAVVTAKTKVDFKHGFSTFIPSSIEETSTRPAPGVKSHLSVKLTDGNIDLKSVQILDMNNNVKQTLPLALLDKEAKIYTTDLFQPPDSTFQIAVVGFDPVSKTEITRQANTPVEVQKTLPGDTINDKSPTVAIQGARNIKAYYGESTKLVCKVGGYPKPTIVWKNKDNGAVLSGKESPGKDYLYDYVSVLTIEYPVLKATYSCEASNRISSQRAEITVDVIRRRYLKITSSSQNLKVESEQEAKITCTVDAYPFADITWYKNDVKLNAGGNIEISGDKSILIIKKAMHADNGKYTCEAKNEDNKQSVDNFVEVIGLEDVVIDKSVTNLSVASGKSATIECKILKGKPKPSISWVLETPQRYVFNVDNWKNQERNVIDNANAQDAGKYRCQAKNDFSQDKHEVRLTVV